MGFSEWTQSSKIVLADLTDSNPNVMYELALANSIGIPAIIISDFIDNVPYELRKLPIITYNSKDENRNIILKEELSAAIASMLKSQVNGVLPAFLKAKPNAPKVAEFSSDLLEIKQLLNKQISIISEECRNDNTLKSKILSNTEFYEAVAKAKELYYGDGAEINDIKRYLINHYFISTLTADDIFRKACEG